VDTPVAVAFISAAVAVLAPAISFYLTKKKDREADSQRYKFEKYQFVNSLSGIVGTDATPEGQRRFAVACNTLHLIASGTVITALHEYQDEISVSNPSRSTERHHALLSRLVRQIRVDLGIPNTPAADEFVFTLWCSGAPPETGLSSGPATH
jgi:hypothetical protein